MNAKTAVKKNDFIQVVQRRMVLVVNVFVCFFLIYFCFVVAICALVHDNYDGYISPSLTANSLWKYFLKYI